MSERSEIFASGELWPTWARTYFEAWALPYAGRMTVRRAATIAGVATSTVRRMRARSQAFRELEARLRFVTPAEIRELCHV